MRVETSAGHGTRVISLQLRPFNEHRALWHDLVSKSAEATLFHRGSWIQLLVRAYSLSLWLATLQENGKITAGCVFARAPLSKRFVALPFSDACAPLAREPEAAGALLNALITRNDSSCSYEIRGIGGAAPWKTVECFVTWGLHFDSPLAGLERRLATNFRRNLRQASRQAVSIERGSSSELLKRFYSMQLQSRRRLGLPPQPWRFFKCVQEIFGAEGNLEVWIARIKGEDVASLVFLRDGEVMHYKWGARRPDDQSCANHLLFWSAVEEFSGEVRMLDLGRTDVRNQGLMRFKRELGASLTPLPSAFYPHAPRQVSAEALTGGFAIAARVWRRMPIFVTPLAGRLVYRFLM
jgi:Acetyltransferase (GNAT) domain